MKIGIIGSGEMGSCLASKFVQSGHDVSIANSRGPASLKQLADDIGAKAVTLADASKNKNVIVVSIPSKNIPYLPKHVFQQLSKATVVIDTGNYYPTLRDGVIPALEQSGIDSQWVQDQLGFPMVKVFNAILATSLRDRGRSKGDKNRIAMAVSGDHTKAKEVVFQLVEGLGFDPFDVGTIAQSWKQQPGTTLYCRDLTLEEMKRSVEAMGAPWSELHDRITAKRKSDEALMKADYSIYLKNLLKKDTLDFY
jgi:hypothetical protein